jgi:hypothetical protein
MSNGGASWIYRYMLKGVACEMGLGPLGLYGLKEARLRALVRANCVMRASIKPVGRRPAQLTLPRRLYRPRPTPSPHMFFEMTFSKNQRHTLT